MRLQDFMTPDVETITPKDTLQTAWQRMRLHRIRHLVVMEHGVVSGILSEREVASLSDFEKQAHLAEDVMETHVATAQPAMTVREAANLMRGRSVGCLPVLDNGRLVGIVTTTDLLDLLGQGIERIVPDTSRRLITREHPGKRSSSGMKL